MPGDEERSPSRPPAGDHLETIGHYRVIEKLGKGGMGVVYRAFDTTLHREVALKFLSPDRRLPAAAQQRQLQEARAAAVINHANIATIFEVGDSEWGSYIAMELVEGQTLHQRVRAGTVGLETAIDWALQLCDAMATAHELGVIHRDIKSTNVMVTPRHRIKVLDFGLALRDASSDSHTTDVSQDRLTESGAVMGTVDYLAPEVLRGSRPTARSDVFALGAVLYELLTGRLPFRAPTSVAVIYAITHEDPPSPSSIVPELPRAIETVVLRALEKDPDRRYATAGELLTELRAAVVGAGLKRSSDAISQAISSAVATGADLAQQTTVANNLPVSTNRFIGRKRELQELEGRLKEHRLVTLLGPGGAGKSRASVELGRRLLGAYPDGVFLVELAPLCDPAQIVPTIGRVLGVREESSGQDHLDTVIAYLQPRRTLLLLDNCEHLIHRCAEVAQRLLVSVPGLKIVATSQERLKVAGESLWPLASLSLPPQSAEDVDELMEFEAVRLFRDRARQVQPGFEVQRTNGSAVAEICRRLDGIPLAIELAATRVRFLPPDKILARLEDRFRLLTGGSRTALPRQQTLRSTVEWSLDLLDEPERCLFRTLSIFVGGMDLDAVEAVCQQELPHDDVLELLTRLVDKSLVMAAGAFEREPRYWLLKTLREFGRSELEEREETAGVAESHARYYTELAERAEPELTGPNQTVWLERLEVESNNLLAAVDWWLQSAEPEQALRVGASIWRFWSVRGNFGPGRKLLTKMLAVSGEPTAERAKALFGAGVLANSQGDYEAAKQHYTECLEIRRSLGDDRGVGEALNSLGIAARDRGEYAQARELLEEGLTMNRQLGDRPGMAMSIHALGITAHREGNCRQARDLFREGLELRQALEDRRGIAALRAHLGSVDVDLGHYDDARPALVSALEDFRELDNKRGIIFALMYLGGAMNKLGNHSKAHQHFAEAMQIALDIGDIEHLLALIDRLAGLAAAREHPHRAFAIEAASSRLRERLGIPRTPVEIQSLDGDLHRSREALSDAEKAQARSKSGEWTLDETVKAALSLSD